MKDAWGRLHECLTRMSDRLATDVVVEDGIATHSFRVFRDSLLENAVELVDMLKHLNITQNADMESARMQLKLAISKYGLEELRGSMVARHAVKNEVDAILGKFNF